jgi:pyruvate kinase
MNRLAGASGQVGPASDVGSPGLLPGTRPLDSADPSSRARAQRGHELAALIERLSAIQEGLREAAEGWRPWVDGRDADRDASARNLLQYLALRGHDLRDLQDRLAALGLSSLGGSEGHVEASVDAVLDALCAIAGRPVESLSGSQPIGFARSRDVLAVRTAALLGPIPRRRPTRIMVTMPTEAATDAGLVREMLVAGMDCMRINCAHDSAPEWHAMRDNLRLAEDETRRTARLLVDLPGPKLRTGPLAAQTQRPQRGLSAAPDRGPAALDARCTRGRAGAGREHARPDWLFAARGVRGHPPRPSRMAR